MTFQLLIKIGYLMEDHIYEGFTEWETSHWWFRARRRILLGLLSDMAGNYSTPKALDLGCGPGQMFNGLDRLSYNVFGMDPSKLALKYASKRFKSGVVCAEAAKSPIRADSLEIVAILDTLEHIEDDCGALKEASRMLKVGGRLIVSVPAYDFLWSDNDRASHHYRRYVIRDLRRKFNDAGLEVEWSSYYNTILFPLILAILFVVKLKQRFLPEKGTKSVNASLVPTPEFIDRILEWIFSRELWLLRRFRMPFGHSLIVVGIKEPEGA